MLAGKFILTGKKEFAKVKESGRLVQSESFGVSYIKTGSQLKFGFIVSNKISNSAVKRNKIKRALKDGVRDFLSEFKTGITLVFFAKPKATLLTRLQIINEVKYVLAKIN